jgi:hypothetical protein
MKAKHAEQHTSDKTNHCPVSGCAYAKHGQKLPNRRAYDSHMAKVHGLGKTDCVVSPCPHIGNNGFTRDQDLISHVRAKHTPADYETLLKTIADHKASTGQDQFLNARGTIE